MWINWVVCSGSKKSCYGWRNSLTEPMRKDGDANILFMRCYIMSHTTQLIAEFSNMLRQIKTWLLTGAFDNARGLSLIKWSS